MSGETMRLQMPLLAPAQAQKHVTVNEALMRLDGMVNLVLQSVSVAVPPEAVLDGQCWGVPISGQGAWSGQGGRIAVGSNGGWVFLPPAPGMRAFVADHGLQAIHDGTDWAVGALSLGAGGSGLMAGMAEGEATLGGGTSVATDVFIPAGALVIGAVGRVASGLTGTLTGWRLGTTGALNRFGQGLGKQEGSWARGLLGSPMAYYQTEPLIVTAEGGTMTGGRIRLAVHWLEMRLPT
ncbi:DUF2793 domain-containing protein [Paracoccus liaowanqingii]|uniref:DUF2793 domain-containing protein n=1 Tax=Paracoccus liaowanqingii TaxID=2560053 RepID=A0A4V1BIY5_9RHOB|nr:DUF2793 domain-containing protein [Paracoccus liaowanqingii]QBX34412.1 DUF2793 domain-containing protein [Paracoccus liaowanqingii]